MPHGSQQPRIKSLDSQDLSKLGRVRDHIRTLQRPSWMATAAPATRCCRASTASAVYRSSAAWRRSAAGAQNAWVHGSVAGASFNDLKPRHPQALLADLASDQVGLRNSSRVVPRGISPRAVLRTAYNRRFITSTMLQNWRFYQGSSVFGTKRHYVLKLVRTRPRETNEQANQRVVRGR